MRTIDQLRILAAARARRDHADKSYLARRRRAHRGMDAVGRVLLYIAVAALAVLIADDLAGADTPAEIAKAFLWGREQLVTALGVAK
jgi:hypothetical protein